MPAYEVEIEHRETDQVFSVFHGPAPASGHGQSMLHFNATLLARLRDQMPAEFRRITLDLDEAVYGLCTNNRGIEEDKVAALTPKSLREPGYGVLYADGTFTIVDGHHRLVRRYRGGVRVMDFWITTEEVWRYCLVDYSAEYAEVIEKALPPRVKDPGLIASSATIYKRPKS